MESKRRRISNVTNRDLQTAMSNVPRGLKCDIFEFLPYATGPEELKFDDFSSTPNVDELIRDDCLRRRQITTIRLTSTLKYSPDLLAAVKNLIRKIPSFTTLVMDYIGIESPDLSFIIDILPHLRRLVFKHRTAFYNRNCSAGDVQNFANALIRAQSLKQLTCGGMYFIDARGNVTDANALIVAIEESNNIEHLVLDLKTNVNVQQWIRRRPVAKNVTLVVGDEVDRNDEVLNWSWFLSNATPTQCLSLKGFIRTRHLATTVPDELNTTNNRMLNIHPEYTMGLVEWEAILRTIKNTAERFSTLRVVLNHNPYSILDTTLNCIEKSFAILVDSRDVRPGKDITIVWRFPDNGGPKRIDVSIPHWLVLLTATRLALCDFTKPLRLVIGVKPALVSPIVDAIKRSECTNALDCSWKELMDRRRLHIEGLEP